MSTVIRIVCLANGAPSVESGRYIVRADVNAHGGRGWLVTTTDPSKARRFRDQATAFEFWNRQSTKLPVRMDGQPNRPLTAFTVEILPVDDVAPGQLAAFGE